MSFLKGLLRGNNKKKTKNRHPHLIRNKNPTEKWDIIGELGDGAFGKVYKVKHGVLLLLDMSRFTT